MNDGGECRAALAIFRRFDYFWGENTLKAVKYNKNIYSRYTTVSEGFFLKAIS